MVLESIINPIKAEKKPWKMFFIGILYSSFAIILSLLVFNEYASLMSVFFTVIASIPIVYYTIKLEENKDNYIHDEKILIKEHGKALSFLIILFIGFVVSFSLWYVFLPESTSRLVFEVQEKTINQINNPLTGNAINFGSTFVTILLNNVKVLVFCLIFAFFYGFGSIFILTWNASIIGAAIGNVVKTGIESNYALAFPAAMTRYFIHGIPEMLAYFMGGLAGGIISVAIIRHDFGKDKFKHILMDSTDLIFGAIAVLVIAALLEVFVTPFIF